MNRDAWYAGIAAAGLLAATAAYGLVAAPKLADPDIKLSRPKLTASLPLPPSPLAMGETLEKAKTILSERDPFVARSGGDDNSAPSLNLPKLGPPVRFSEPGQNATVTSVASSPARVTPSANAPAPQPQSTTPAPPTRGSLTLRGVFPSPSGGRALVALPDGRVVSVGVGGDVGGWRVLQVQQGAIRLGRGQRTILLAMPR